MGGASTPVPTSAVHPLQPLVPHPETCVLSTAELPSGRVSARTVYLKELSAPEAGPRSGAIGSDPAGVDDADAGLDAGYGFVVYSNTSHSRKAADLRTNSHAALTFWWEGLERQVRVEGTVHPAGREEGQKYYDTRGRGSRIGAWASRQSWVLEPRGGGRGGSDGKDEGGEATETAATTTAREGDDGRAQLDEWVREAEARFDGVERIPMPDHWGGLRLVPDRVEFWQGRESRLHDRFVYERLEDGKGWSLKRLSP